jgi:aldose 1-epimerase
MSVATVVLRDTASNCEAEILTGYGFNCHRFQACPEGQLVEVLWAEEGFAAGDKRASGSGIPILFPFPGRIQGTRFVWDNREYRLPEGDGNGNAIHGFVHCRPWRVLRQSDDMVLGQFQASIDDPTLRDQWPADFRITATYRLQANCLSCEYLLENPDNRPLPCGFGTHPYFRVPVDARSQSDQCRVLLPVSSSWELANMNATGQNQPLADRESFQAGLPFSEMQLDNVFGGLTFAGDWCTAQIQDAKHGRRVELSFDETFRECVVYNPPHRQAVCIEPYTCVPDCFRLQTEGIDAGLLVLAPGQSLTARMTIRAR